MIEIDKIQILKSNKLTNYYLKTVNYIRMDNVRFFWLKPHKSKKILKIKRYSKIFISVSLLFAIIRASFINAEMAKNIFQDPLRLFYNKYYENDKKSDQLLK